MKPRPVRFPAMARSTLPWVSVAPHAPYFQTEDGAPWHPIGQNDAVSWHELNPLFRRRDVPAVRAHLAMLAEHGVTCMRLMLEYAQVRHRYFEKAPGAWSPAMVQFWDDLLALCEEHQIRLLLTPFDTFWMWLKFKHHPYNVQNGGPLSHPSRLLLCAETRTAIRGRLTFAVERWGGSGAIFAWDLWNEIHPAQAEMSAEPFHEFIEDLSTHVQQLEVQRFGRAHPRTVSLFGPELKYHPHMNMEAPIFRHPALDFATVHMYEHGTIDDPANTVDAAVSMGRQVRESLAEITDQRPFFDSEHGPIHRFKDHHESLPEPFDGEYFRHMQWAHLASGGAGGGMRWPNRHPHSLTPEMRAGQLAMSRFMPLLDWGRFDRVNVSDELGVVDAHGAHVAGERVGRFACASGDQALVHLVRRDSLGPNGMLDTSASPLTLSLTVPRLASGRYLISGWDTAGGRLLAPPIEAASDDAPWPLPPFVRDLALAVKRVES